jgi:hypothetical protein
MDNEGGFGASSEEGLLVVTVVVLVDVSAAASVQLMEGNYAVLTI